MSCVSQHGDDNVFLMETSTLNVIKRKFLKLEKYEINGVINSFYEIGKKICKILEATLFVIMGFNISEGVMYYKIFSHMHRLYEICITYRYVFKCYICV